MFAIFALEGSVQETPHATEASRALGRQLSSHAECGRIAGVSHPVWGELLLFVAPVSMSKSRRLRRHFRGLHEGGGAVAAGMCVVCFTSGWMEGELQSGAAGDETVCVELPSPWCTDLFIRGPRSSSLASLVRAVLGMKGCRMLPPKGCSKEWLEENLTQSVGRREIVDVNKKNTDGEGYWGHVSDTRPTELELLLGREEFLRVTRPLIYCNSSRSAMDTACLTT